MINAATMDAAVSEPMRATILTDLARIEAEEDARILLAIESGSRAWGFHSTDSDYDVRFVYARPVDWHLTVYPGRDVIERPISDELDISGWDLRKTLGLILKSNAVALEWLQSPIRYREAPGFANDLLAFAQSRLQRRPVMWHYLRLAERQRERLHDAGGTLKLKAYFYTIRPALALRWMRLHPGAAFPPMDMAGLMEGADLGPDLRHRITELTAAKARADEAGRMAASPAETDALIDAEIGIAEAALADGPPETHQDQVAEADALHRKWTRSGELR